MVFVRQWQDFAQAVQGMQAASTSQVRYCTRWSHSKGRLVLKVTDGTQCLQFSTRSALFLNRFQLLTVQAMTHMQGAPQRGLTDAPPSLAIPLAKPAIETAPEAKESGTDVGRTSKASAGASTSKKKKTKKRK